MAAICGIIGKRDVGVVLAMARALEHRAGPLQYVVEGEGFTVASSAAFSTPPCLMDGAPYDEAGRAMVPDDLLRLCRTGQDPSRLKIKGSLAAAVCLGDDRGWWLIRDALGRKPLYYTLGTDCLLFASELKALVASGRVSKHLNLAGVDRYLTLRCVPPPDTMLRDVSCVRPGHVLEYRLGKMRETAFSTFELQPQKISREEAAARLRELLTAAVARSAGSALLWSSGLDCAVLAALDRRLRPVFVNMERAWQDESRVAKESTKRLRLPLGVCTARRTTEETFAKAAYALDEPIADASVVPLWLVMEAARSYGPALVSGHGADELLGGYPRYNFLQKARGARALVPATFLSWILPTLPPNAFVRRGSRYLASMREDFQAYLSLAAVFDQEERAVLYTDAMRAALRDHGPTIGGVQRLFDHPDLTSNLLALDLSVGLPCLLLTKCDRLASAHGLSVTFPYLDDDVVRFAATLPAKTKFGVRSKPLLRIAMKRLLPARIRLRARRDFRTPQGGRLVQVIENVARQTITPDRVDATGLFRWPYVEQILQSAGHNVYRRRQFWALLMFFAWYRQMLET